MGIVTISLIRNSVKFRIQNLSMNDIATDQIVISANTRTNMGVNKILFEAENFKLLTMSKFNFSSYKMMTECWQENPEKRPTFTQLRESLETMMQKDNPYLDLTAVDESRAYYNVPSFNSIMEESSDDIDDVIFGEDDQKKEGPNKYVELTIQGEYKTRNPLKLPCEQAHCGACSQASSNQR